METIYKYKLNPGVTFLDLPTEAQVLTVQVQEGEPCMWIKLDPKAKSSKRMFICYGTGHEIAIGDLKYIATFQINEGVMPLVFHVFEML